MIEGRRNGFSQTHGPKESGGLSRREGPMILLTPLRVSGLELEPRSWWYLTLLVRELKEKPGGL